MFRYGGGETKVQTWPIETEARPEAPFVTGDFLQNVAQGGVVETYWLTSSGVAIHVDEDTPLFTSKNLNTLILGAFENTKHRINRLEHFTPRPSMLFRSRPLSLHNKERGKLALKARMISCT